MRRDTRDDILVLVLFIVGCLVVVSPTLFAAYGIEKIAERLEFVVGE